MQLVVFVQNKTWKMVNAIKGAEEDANNSCEKSSKKICIMQMALWK